MMDVQQGYLWVLDHVPQQLSKIYAKRIHPKRLSPCNHMPPRLHRGLTVLQTRYACTPTVPTLRKGCVLSLNLTKNAMGIFAEYISFRQDKNFITYPRGILQKDVV